MNTLNIITAVSRPWNLPVILRSIETPPRGSNLQVAWTLIFDGPQYAPPYVREALSEARKTDIRPLFYPGGKSKFGIPQKNMGIDASAGGWFIVLDDDTILHPRYLDRISQEIYHNRDKRAFIYNQRRWDSVGSLKASPKKLCPGGVDNGMATFHADLVGNERHDQGLAGKEDAAFIKKMYEKHPNAFHFIDEELSYYNYLDVARIPDWQLKS